MVYRALRYTEYHGSRRQIAERVFMSKRVCLALILCIAALPAFTQTKDAIALPSEETVNGFLKYTFGFDDGTTWKIVKIQPSSNGLAEVNVVVAQKEQQAAYKLLVTPDGKHVVVGEVIPFGVKPYEPVRKQLEAGANGPVKGSTTAPVTIVEFSDFQCPHCKEAQPAIEKLLAAHPEVKFVFQNFPLSMHDWARKAASYADCVGRADKAAFWKFSSDVFEKQSEITLSNSDEKLTAIADAAGVKGTDIANCAGKPDTDTRVQKSIDLGAAVEVTSTPSFFINGRKISNIAGIPDDVLTKILAFHAKEDK
jgi:protein-disulfide isomerase